MKPYHKRKQYLRVRVDTCADVNVMPASVYKEIFKDPNLSKLGAKKVDLFVYNESRVDIIGSCIFYMHNTVHDKVIEVTFHIARNDGSVLLSCQTTFDLSLVQAKKRLEYVPPKAKLICSEIDNPKKCTIQAMNTSAKKSTQDAMNTSAKKSTQDAISTSAKKSTPNADNTSAKKSTSNAEHTTAKRNYQNADRPFIVRTKEQMMEHYGDVFEGIGRFPGEPYHIQLDPSVKPKQTPCRPVALHLKDAFRAEIDKMLKLGVIRPVHHATPWINSFVLVESKDKKTGKPKLRICLDPTNLNKAIVREPYCFRTPDDIAHKLANAKHITVVDMNKGYWHEALDAESQLLTTFNTEEGRFCFTVMPFGTTVAGDVFQRKLDTIINKVPQVTGIADDLMIVGYEEDGSDHDKALTELLETCRKNNLKLNYDKIQYKAQSVEFFGETYTVNGRLPSKDKVKAIAEMPEPKNLKEVQTFNGMLQYLSKFSARIAELSEPVRDLTRKNAPFMWGPEHSDAFKMLKKEITEAPVLRYYDPKKPVTLQTDASGGGLGAVLLQEQHPVYFASKALTDAEKGYVAIELEALAIAWAMEKFHHFLYANHFTLETDQKPLVAILTKSLNEATPRMQRLLMRTLPYDFEIKYLPGPQNQLADCLSRIGCQKDQIQLPKVNVNEITATLTAPAAQLTKLKNETEQDDELVLLKDAVMKGWPKTIQDLPQEIQPYWNFREELTIEDGLVLKLTRIVIPKSMHNEILQQLHAGHLGLTKCKERARETVYWPGLYDQLKELVTNCEICLKYSTSNKSPAKEQQMGQEIPLTPWTKLASDIFHFENASYLLVVDYHSRFPVICKLDSMSAHNVTNYMRAIFSEYGWPEKLITDNGPCYKSDTFKSAMHDMGVEHITSSPHYPQSNGLAEKYVQIAKNLLYKAR